MVSNAICNDADKAYRSCRIEDGAAKYKIEATEDNIKLEKKEGDTTTVYTITNGDDQKQITRDGQIIYDKTMREWLFGKEDTNEIEHEAFLILRTLRQKHQAKIDQEMEQGKRKRTFRILVPGWNGLYKLSINMLNAIKNKHTLGERHHHWWTTPRHLYPK